MFLHITIVLVLVTYGTESKVVDGQFTPCKKFFYKQSPPSGLEDYDELKQICQRYNNRYHFASAHSSNYRIPIYSAYTLDQFSCRGSQPDRRSAWFVEPQLAVAGHQNDMVLAGALAGTYGEVQAVNIDYQNTNYDKGHLNPNFYQCDDGRTATFTLTNAVPQDPCFNQQEWKNMEKLGKQIMENYCNFPGAKRYFVTGAVPTTVRIPFSYTDKEGDRPREYDRVSVPSLMWTAACCYASIRNRNRGFSFGYYGHNIADSLTVSVTVDELQTILMREYNIDSLSIFVDSCSPDPVKTNTIITNELNIPSSRSMVHDITQYSKTNVQSVQSGKKRKYLKNVDAGLTENQKLAQHIWFLEDIKFGMVEKRGKIQDTKAFLNQYSLTPLLSFPNTHYYKVPYTDTIVHDELRKRDTANRANTKQSDELEDTYLVVPFLDGTISATGSRCLDEHPCDFYGERYKWCYIDREKNWDYCCTDECDFASTSYSWCNSGTREWAYCSVRGSVLTVKGFRCRADHECGTHGESYYWCYTDTKNNWSHCCQPWHKCSDYGYSYRWCYTGAKERDVWQYCHY